jgi:hypothetical protein
VRLSHKALARKAGPLVHAPAGFIQALMLLLLTTLFGSSFGNDLLKTFIFVLVFGALVFGLRILSIWVSKHLQETTNLSIIDCDTTDGM